MPRFIRSAPLRSPNEGIERHTTWLEIFFDLIFSVIVVQLSNRLITHLNFIGIFQCAAMFLPVLWTWVSYNVFVAVSLWQYKFL
jgi:low temperature requirement protein LtrA